MGNEKLAGGLAGIYTALLTPMDEEGRLDPASLERLVEYQIGQGVHGFYAGGSTGEAFLLTGEERMQLLETIVRAADGRAKVIAHIGSIGTMESIRLARHAESLGVDAVSAVAPFYYSIGMREIRSHYQAIMAAVPLPMIVYHYPAATGVDLSLDFYEEMAGDPQCAGVKFTSRNLFEMQQIRARCGERFLIWNGHDEVYAGGALMGADGAIGSTFNMMPGLYVRMFQASARGEWDAVHALQTEANEVIAHMLNYAVIPTVIPYEKDVVHWQGIIDTPVVRSPLKQFTDEERAEIAAFAARTSVLSRAVNGNKQERDGAE